MTNAAMLGRLCLCALLLASCSTDEAAPEGGGTPAPTWYERCPADAPAEVALTQIGELAEMNVACAGPSGCRRW